MGRNIPSPPHSICEVLLGEESAGRPPQGPNDGVAGRSNEISNKSKCQTSCSGSGGGNGSSGIDTVQRDAKLQDPRLRGKTGFKPEEPVGQSEPTNKEPADAVIEEGEISETPSRQPKRPKREGRVPCKYWMEGKCSKGAACTFSHSLVPHRTPSDVRSANARPLTSDELLAAADSSGRSLWETITQGVCRFELAATGGCGKGDHCLFSHDVAHKVPCRFWHAWGRCAAGGSCRFSHAPIVDGRVRERIKREALDAVKRDRASGSQQRRSASDRILSEKETAEESTFSTGISAAADDGHENGDDKAELLGSDAENNALKVFKQELEMQLNPFA